MQLISKSIFFHPRGIGVVVNPFFARLDADEFRLVGSDKDNAPTRPVRRNGQVSFRFHCLCYRCHSVNPDRLCLSTGRSDAGNYSGIGSMPQSRKSSGKELLIAE